MRGCGDYAMPEEERPYILGGETVPVVEVYKYLGVMFNDRWSWSDNFDYV